MSLQEFSLSSGDRRFLEARIESRTLPQTLLLEGGAEERRHALALYLAAAIVCAGNGKERSFESIVASCCRAEVISFTVEITSEDITCESEDIVVLIPYSYKCCVRTSAQFLKSVAESGLKATCISVVIIAYSIGRDTAD